VIQARLKAYIGPIEEAEAFTVDNKFIVRGYRINHNTCGRLAKSLFTCHNEFVNVWSHIGGVLVFLIMITVVCCNVLPN
jgi:predicted membrane channel-forming protein YqfA (hemolysin III family)